jgi:Fic family protein
VPDEQLGKITSGPAIAARVNNLAEMLTSDTAAPAIVVGAIAHAEIAVVDPFADASGLIARAANTWC